VKVDYAWRLAVERIIDNQMNSFRWIASELQKCLSIHHQPQQETRLRVLNQTRNTLLAACMEVADSSAKRNKGLLGRESLASGEGLWIRPCESVHTFWMRFPIDLVYIDRNNRIRKLVSAVPAWRLSACLTAHSVLELPSGTIRATQSRVGDMLEFSAALMTHTAE
jgi:uncharacterized membrane protein (UPF0127 family)